MIKSVIPHAEPQAISFVDLEIGLVIMTDNKCPIGPLFSACSVHGAELAGLLHLSDLTTNLNPTVQTQLHIIHVKMSSI